MTIKFLVTPCKGMPPEEVSARLANEIDNALKRLRQHNAPCNDLFEEIICEIDGKRVMTNHFEGVLSLALKLENSLILATEEG